MLVIFDLDDTLIHEGFEDVPGAFLFPSTLEILRWLRARGHELAIASHNDDAHALLTKNGIEDFFDCVVGYQPRCGLKTPLLKAVLRHFQGRYGPSDCVYYDDVQVHVREATDLGIRGLVVPHLDGITWALIAAAIDTGSTSCMRTCDCSRLGC